jgi:major vault protein
VELSSLKSEAKKTLETAETEYNKSKHNLEIMKATKLKDLEIFQSGKLSEIEGTKFKNIVEAIGQDTLVSISKAGPELQAELLGSLGMSGYLMMDANNPINLFNAANGLIAPADKQN